ncbi:putative bifunctional diguanylate cyclase/phosphodiesterase [Desulfogranum japonicum]|uniref:putative bifunctional diguanylate cyclase/phosphodiesterase n=1 Tax=Desulfogranum japonicum TaxID=231447 RepID=UPI0004072EF0|nr:EAL domain-containing protein [Desulfogranum japonicum]
MKLSKKVPFLIITVLLLTFCIMSSGLYLVERNFIRAQTRSSLLMQATELAGSFSQYSLMARGILASIMQSDALRRFLDSDDDQMKSIALGSGLDTILKDLTALSSDHFSLLFVTGTGKQEYYYESSDNPFADPAPAINDWVTTLLKNRTPSAMHYFNDLKRIAIYKAVDRITLKESFDFGSKNTIAVVVTLSPTEFYHRVDTLKKEDRIVSLLTTQNTDHSPKNFEEKKLLPGFGAISIQVPAEIIQKELNQTLIRFGILFLILLCLTHFALQFLLQRYVLHPIHRLEQQLKRTDLDATKEIIIHESNDEIGSLNRSFAQLYDKLKETYEGTKELAERDTLTTLYNRRVFNLILTKLIKRAEHNKTNVCLIYIDLDNFKYVNDYYGHTTGDALLKAFAFRLHEVVRGSDYVITIKEQDTTVARLAGDEFAVIVHGFSNTKAISRIAERILHLCKDGFTCEEGTFPVTLSMGIASYPHDGATAEDLIVNADSAMYESKKSGKNTVSYYSQELTEISRRQQLLEIELKKLNYEELELHYMPIVRSDSETIYSFEALIRWFSPTLGFVPPAEFIPIVESLGIYRDVDLWVIDQAFMHSRQLREHFGNQVKVSINISAAELSKANFQQEILPIIKQHDIDPSMFTLELTETFYQKHSDTGLTNLTDLGNLGFELAIDDLGSGYTSLLQLVELPIHMVKLDKTFVEKTLASGKHTLLRSLIDLCHAQKILVTAEGVETGEDAIQLREAGCDCLQGYYYCKPFPLPELIQKVPKKLFATGSTSNPE